MKLPDISIIITTKNEEKNIKNCLMSIEQNKNVQKEVIVVDNYSTDKTLEIAKQFDCKIYQKGEERSKQRNFGIQQSNSDIILFLDCDMIIGPELLFNYKKFLIEKKKQNCIGLYIPEIILGNNFYSKVRRFERLFYNGTVIDCARIFFKKDFFEIGMFDENLTGPEDWDFDKRLRKKGDVLFHQFNHYDSTKWNIDLLNLIKNNIDQEFLNNSFIYHNEKSMNFKKNLFKKFVYSKDFGKYINKWPNNDPDIRKQLGPFYRLIVIFFEKKNYLKTIQNLHLFLPLILFKLIVGLTYLIKKK